MNNSDNNEHNDDENCNNQGTTMNDMFENAACVLTLALAMAMVVLAWIFVLNQHAEMVQRNLIYRGEWGTWIIQKIMREN